MLSQKAKEILNASRAQGWVMEPDAKRFFAMVGLPVPDFQYATRLEAAIEAAEKLGYPVVGKVVSPKILHKSEVGGVIIGIANEEELTRTYRKFSMVEGFSGMLLERPLTGMELIIGAKADFQFGPVILLGIGGVSVEVYDDTCVRMAPLTEGDVRAMIQGLKAHQLITGYRGRPPVNLDRLISLVLTFSDLVMALEGLFASIDLNPVMCTKEDCVIADARILLERAEATP